ncbi:hypothetical protein GCM10022197_01070 [Microlunatus spumicola]|uniref:DUF3558 domain-containing protein n=1 Tax=Microlunatus spumicola TaxID=81499 RepID=A0ABP6WE23_9ACTN
MPRTTLLPALALAALALSGCGGSGDAGAAPATSAPAASAPASSAAAPSDATTPASTPSTGTAPAEVKDACKVLDADDVEDLTGVKVDKGTTQAVGGSSVCTWVPSDAKAADAAVFSAQEGPLPGPLSQVEGQLESQFDGKVTKLSVTGADDARYLTGKKSGLNVIDVLAQKDEIFYQVLVATPRDAGQHKDGAIKIVEALLKA